jgi:hypothetical protein
MKNEFLMAAPAISHGTVKMNDLMNVTSGQPFANNFETPEDGKHTGVPRRPSAGLHPEDK